LRYVAKGPTEFQLLRFWDDGTFNLYLRTHLSIEQRQSGTWRIDPSGDLELLGGWRRKLVHEPFTVAVYHGASGPGADEIERELSAFLRSKLEQVDFGAVQVTALANRNGESE